MSVQHMWLRDLFIHFINSIAILFNTFKHRLIQRIKEQELE
jgi:hypothetical protein